ncbi:MAG: ATP-binding protein, partial [Verrucomicrobiota bacterium]
PLNSLNIHMQLMERDARKLPDEEAKRFQETVEVCKREVQRLDAIINQFLGAVRPTLPEMELMSPVKLLEEAIVLMQVELEDRKILLECEFDGQVPQLRIDPEQMKQVFYNLIKNAMQAMVENGILRIAVETDDEYVIIGFQDNGTGISAEDMPHILEPYFTTKQRGTGLGLMVVQRIIQDHGGLLELDSDKGKGTTVKIRLPLLQRRVRMLKAGEDDES